MNNVEANWYSRQIKRVPMLTPAEEISLGTTVQAWLNDPNPSRALERRGRRAKDRMVEANLRLVMTVANKWSRQVPPAEFMDLVQAGNLGLVRAVEKFDPTRGYKFSTYAYWWIRQGVSRHIETYSRVIRLPSSVMQKLHQITGVTRRLVFELHRNPTKAELAEALEISTSDLEDLIGRGDHCLSLDARARSDESLSAIVDLIADPSGGNSDEQLDQLADAHTSQRLMSYLDELNARQRHLIEGTIGLHADKKPITVLAKELNIKPALASRLLREAKTRLRWLINTQQPITHPKPPPPPLPAAYVELISQLEFDGWLVEATAEPTRTAPRRIRRPRQEPNMDQPSFW